MANELDRLYAALRAADAAGDSEAVARLADYIRQYESSSDVSADAVEPLPPEQEPEQEEAPESIFERLRQGWESAVTSPVATDIGRAGGVVARGVMGLPAMVVQAGQEAYNLAAPKSLQIPPQHMALNDLYATTTRGGEPPTGSLVVEGGLGALTGAGLAGSVAKTAGGTLKNFADTLAQRQGAQGVAGMSSGGAVEVARDQGAGVVGQTAAALAGGMAPSTLGAGMRQATKTTVQPGYRDVLQRSQEAGLSVPPGYVTRTHGMAYAEGLAGKEKMQQQFSVKNAPVIDSLAKKELGIPEHTDLTPEVYEAYRASKGNAYKEVKKAFELPGATVKIKADQEFKDALESIGGNYGEASQQFSGLFKSEAIDNLKAAVGRDRFSADAALEAVRKLRKDASANMKIYDPEKNAIGMAQRRAADALDALVERNLIAIGKGDLAANYRRARVDIAKSHDLEAATDPATNSVSATRLAAIARKRDMSGGMKTIADFGQAFPKAAQDPSKIGTIPAIGNLEALGGLVTSPVVTLAGPVMRGVMGTKGYQQAMVRERPGASPEGMGAAGLGSVQGVAQASQAEVGFPDAAPLSSVPMLKGVVSSGMSKVEVADAINKLPTKQRRLTFDWLSRHGTLAQRNAWKAYASNKGNK